MVMGRVKNMAGHEFNGCRVLERSGTNRDKKATWLCKCFCGKEFITTGKTIRQGDVKSCGCLRLSIIKKQGKLNKRHGETKTRLYSIWHGMKKRCSLEGETSYKHYGAKGIRVCEEWRDSFESFRDWSLANGYNDQLTIDRIDSNGDYEPANCRWTDWYGQARNRSNNVKVEYKGKMMTQGEVSELTGLSRQLIYYRTKHGIDYDKPKRSVKQDEGVPDYAYSPYFNRGKY